MDIGSMGDRIGNWTQTQLTKWLRDIFQTQPPDFFPLIRAEEIQATKKLVLGEELAMIREASFRKVGAMGQPTFQNSWVNYGSGWREAGFWRDPFGVVHLRGLIASGTIGQTAFTLPPGFRPSASEVFATVSNNLLGRVSVLSGGAVVCDVGSNVWLSLSGITFRTS